MTPTPDHIKRLTDRGAEIYDPNDSQDSINEVYRGTRQYYFSTMWDRIAQAVEASVDATIVKGEIPSAEQRAELYLMQMHAIAHLSLFGVLRDLCQGHFQPGFLEAAMQAAVLTPEDLPWYSTMNLEADFAAASDDAASDDATRGFAEAMKFGCRIVHSLMTEEQKTSILGARNKDAMVLVPGFVDARMRRNDQPRSLDVDPARMPNRPLDEVDFAEDVIQGLRMAGSIGKMQEKAHEFVSKRILLNEIHLWRRNYFRLEV